MNRNRLFVLTKGIFALLFVFYVVWGLLVSRIDPTVDSLSRTFFSYSYGSIALLGGMLGIIVGSKWGGRKSVMGRSIQLFSLGLLFQVLGQASYSFYDFFLGIEVPYPSIGDIGWFMTIPCYFLGSWHLAKASGMTFLLKKFQGKLFAVIIPFLLLMFSYRMFLRQYQFDWSNPIVIFLDFSYPLGHAIYISMAMLAFLFSLKYLGGIMKNTILLVIVAMVFQYLGDFTFLYQVSTDTFYWGGVYDYFFLASYILMSFSLISFGSIFKRLSEEN